jgi:hypothetical protein
MQTGSLDIARAFFYDRIQKLFRIRRLLEFPRSTIRIIDFSVSDSVAAVRQRHKMLRNDCQVKRRWRDA